jgi:hypothetical protein
MVCKIHILQSISCIPYIPSWRKNFSNPMYVISVLPTTCTTGRGAKGRSRHPRRARWRVSEAFPESPPNMWAELVGGGRSSGVSARKVPVPTRTRPPAPRLGATCARTRRAVSRSGMFAYTHRGEEPFVCWNRTPCRWRFGIARHAESFAGFRCSADGFAGTDRDWPACGRVCWGRS